MANELAGYLGNIFINVGSSGSFTTEATTAIDTLNYQITDTSKRFLDDEATFHVYVDAIEVTDGFEIQHPVGKIVFESNPNGTVTISGKNFTMEEAGNFYKWSINIEKTEIDVSKFGDQWKNTQTVIGNWNASASKYFVDETYTDKIGTKSLYQFFVDEDSDIYYTGYGYIKKGSINTATNDVIKEDLEVIGTHKIYYVD